MVCDRGVIGRVAKGSNVLAGGAGGMILINDAPNAATLNADTHVLPATHISYDDGVALKFWLSTGTDHTGTITGNDGPAYNDIWGDAMAAFSSRGPNTVVPDVIKPDVAAPGLNVMAAYATFGDPPPPEFNMISGTSMASPHAAGAAALLTAVHPDWTPAEIQSALMSTGVTQVVKEDEFTPADPFDMGAGRVDLTVAAEVGFVLDISEAEYLAANPAEGGAPGSLNLSTLAENNCVVVCSWTRTLTSVAADDVEYTTSTSSDFGLDITVEPADFTLPAGGTQEVTVTVDPGGAEPAVWSFGEVRFTPVTPGRGGDVIAEQHFTVAAIPVSAELPALVEIHTRRDAGSQVVEDITASEITDLTVREYGLVEGLLTQSFLAEDSDNSSAYDDLTDGVTFVTHEVSEGAIRLVAEVTASDAPDVDMFVGMDMDGDNAPDANEELCSSTTASFIEYCNLDDPEPGTYWVLVQNWQGSGAATDYVELWSAVVPGAGAGNMTVEGPASVPGGEPFDLRVFWDEPELAANERWYGAFDIGPSAGSPGTLGDINVNLIRHPDDVSKVGPETASYGEVIDYTITVQPNVTPEDLTYYITDTIPAGTTYVDGSASATAGTVVVQDGVLTWEGNLPSPSSSEGTYLMTTSMDDPACTMPLATDGAYVDLEQYGLLADPDVEGDTVTYTFDTSGNPPSLTYYGQDVGNNINFTDDGFLFFDPAEAGDTPWVNTPLPDPSDPNATLAVFWTDLEIVYDGATNRGVTLVNLTSGGIPVAHIVEYDDVEVFDSGGAQTYDFEVIVYREVVDAAGEYEIIYAYDNLNGPFDPLTIGLENFTGTSGVEYTYNDPNVMLEDGMAICFDYTGASFEPVTITFQVMVDENAPGTVVNTVDHITDNPGAEVATAEATTLIGDATAVQTSTLDATRSTSTLPLVGLGLTLAAMAGIAIWRRRR